MPVKPGWVRGVILTLVSTRIISYTCLIGCVHMTFRPNPGKHWNTSQQETDPVPSTPLSFGSWGHPTSFTFSAVMLPLWQCSHHLQTPPEVQPARSPFPSLFPSSWKNTSIMCSDLARRGRASFWVTGFQFCRNYDWLTDSIELCGQDWIVALHTTHQKATASSFLEPWKPDTRDMMTVVNDRKKRVGRIWESTELLLC